MKAVKISNNFDNQALTELFNNKSYYISKSRGWPKRFYSVIAGIVFTLSKKFE
jgi:hypothetical protein